jgi:hypothetical protein
MIPAEGKQGQFGAHLYRFPGQAGKGRLLRQVAKVIELIYEKNVGDTSVQFGKMV